MTTTTEQWQGRAALMVAHCAGMVDLVALPVWVGTLIASYHLDPQQAGGLVSLFLVGAVLSSLFFASRFHRIPPRLAAAGGYAAACAAFIGAALSSSYAAMAVLHAAAGVAAACGLSFTHGTIGRSERPHRLFALVGMALGLFAIPFLGGTPKAVQALGGQALFWIFGGVMGLAAVASALAFPTVAQRPERQPAPAGAKLASAAVMGALGVACMALAQAMMFSFLERIGADRGFSSDAVTGVLIALGIVNLFPAPLAAWLEHKLPARGVLIAGPVLQAVLALLMTQTSTFAPYAGAAMFVAAVMIFTHTFAFGLLATLEPTGRLVAATPAMLMTGSAIGPLLAGTIVKFSGYGLLGWAIVVIAVMAVACFVRARPAPAGAVAVAGVVAPQQH